jgi:hypothetical protein
MIDSVFDLFTVRHFELFKTELKRCWDYVRHWYFIFGLTQCYEMESVEHITMMYSATFQHQMIY